MKCEHERICDNCKLDGSRDCRGCYNGLDHKKFSCKLCNENKPLTIAELGQMDGEPAWMVLPLRKTNKEEWVLVNVVFGGVCDNRGEIYYFSNFNNDKICCYKTKPPKQPRAVKFEQAIKDELMVKLAEQIEFRTAIKAIEKEICSRPHRSWDLFNLPVWEVKEG